MLTKNCLPEYRHNRTYSGRPSAYQYTHCATLTGELALTVDSGVFRIWQRGVMASARSASL